MPKVFSLLLLAGLLAALLVAVSNVSGQRGGPAAAVADAQAVDAAALSAVVPPDPAPPGVEASGNPLLEADAMLVSPALLGTRLTAEEKESMAAQLDRLATRHAAQLVSVISSATQEAPSAIPPSFLLSIAFAETRGKVLAVSPAGAAGLAQATPAAYLMEGFVGPLYVTNQYLIGTRAFIMKKPLGDAVGIAGRVIDGEASYDEAEALLAEAKALRQVGIDELEALAPRAPEVFMVRVRAADEYNAEALDTLGELLERRAGKAELTRYRDRLQKEYRSLLRVQQVNWERYADSLERERDRVLRGHFGDEPAKVILERPYEAGEVLGQKLDGRFSPSLMAAFLQLHADTKRRQAIALGVPEDEIEAWTAALYNGGLVNVTRLRAGLMRSLGETENYMRKVPELRQRLDAGAAVVSATPPVLAAR